MIYSRSDFFFDFESPVIQDLIQEFNTASLSDKEKASLTYLKVRDGWRYNPYRISFQMDHYKASYIAQKAEGHCIDKSILLIACLRGLGIPARLHLAKVKNHIAVERLEEKFGTNEMTPHGMVNIYLDDQWLKASPAFNASLCAKCNVAPLEFTGEQDSIFQEYDKEGGKFMEYLDDYGHFPDVPIEFIRKNIIEHYPKFQHLINSNKELIL